MAYTRSKRTKNSDAPEVVQRYYLNNAKLLPEVLKAKADGHMTNELAKMLMLLTQRYASRPCFSGYSYREDMVSDALTNLCQNALKFNPDKSNNPFSFYTTCINNSFLQFLNAEKKHRKIRDQLLVDMGENPSYNFQEEVNQQNKEGANYAVELGELKTNIEEARNRLKHDAVVEAAKAAKNAAEAAKLLGEAAVLELVIAEASTNSSLLDFDDGDELIGESNEEDK